MVHADNGILFTLKRDEPSRHKKTWRKLKCILLSERSQSEETTYSRILIMTLGKRQNYGRSGCQRLGGRVVNRWSKENF